MAKMTLMRKLFLTGIIISISLISSAQGRFGIKAGLNYFMLQSDNSKTTDYSSGQIGFLGGLSYQLSISPRFSLQPELNLSLQKAKEDYYGTDIEMSYVQVPFLFKFNPKNSKVELYTGPQFGFLNKADYTKSNGIPGSSSDFVQTDFGVTLGVGHVPDNPGISFDVRVYQGLSNVLKSEYSGGIKTRPFLAAVTIGYVWGKRK